MNRLKELRKEKGLTQQELADKIGVTKRTYIYWEKGDRVPKSDKAQQLADYFSVPVGYLLGYDVPRNKIPYETFTPREYNAWEEYSSLGLDKTNLSFNIYEELRNNRQFDKIYLEILGNYALSSSENQEAIRQLAKTTAKADSGYNIHYETDD